MISFIKKTSPQRKPNKRTPTPRLLIPHRLQLKPAGTEGFRKAEVTVGGVFTDSGPESCVPSFASFRLPTAYCLSPSRSQARSRALLYRRSGGRDGPTGRLQLSVGLGLGFRRRTGCVIELSNSEPSDCGTKSVCGTKWESRLRLRFRRHQNKQAAND